MPPARFERTAPGLGILCSIHLSYGGDDGDLAKSEPAVHTPAEPRHDALVAIDERSYGNRVRER